MDRRELLRILAQAGLLPMVAACAELLPDPKNPGGGIKNAVKVATLDQLNQSGKYVLTSVPTATSASHPVVIVAVSSATVPTNALKHPTVAGLYLLTFSRVCTHQGTTIDAPANGLMNCPNHGQDFDVKTGNPTGSANKTSTPLPSFPLEIRNTNEVWLGGSGSSNTLIVALSASSDSVTAAGSVTLTATLTSGNASKVEFYEGTTLLATKTAAPYTHSIAYTAANNGSHSYTAKAYDASGNTATSPAVTVEVNIAVPDTTNPTVSLAASNNNLTAAGSVNLTATASDNVGIAKVEFYEGTTLLSTATASPFVHTLSFAASNNGSHTYTAKAFDAAGNVASSNAVTVVVNINNNTGDTTPPTVGLASNSNNVTAAGSITLTATATDNVGVTKVEIFEGTTLLATKTAAPYTHSITYSSANNGPHSYTAKAYDAAGNVATSSAVTVTVNIAAPTGQKVAVLSDFPAVDSFKKITATIGGVSWNIVIIRTANGQPACGGASANGVNLVAYSTKCTHKGTTVDSPSGGKIHCSDHGADFDYNTCAKVVTWPNNNPANNIPPLPSFVLTIDGSGNVYLPK